jgi:hypothetical protein
MSSAAPIKKRGPGRPPKKSLLQPLKHEGIVDFPTDPQNKFELVYSDPKMFKGLFTYFKNIKSDNFHIRCSKEEITFFTWGINKENRVIAKIDGNSLNRYYCEETFWMGAKRDKFYQVFTTVNKSFSKVTIVCKHDDDAHIEVIFYDGVLDRNCTYKIKLKELDEDNKLFEAEALISEAALRKYPINFVLSSSQFKTSITDASSIENKITIEKIGNSPLQITTPSGKDIVYEEVYKSDTKIKLISSVEDSMTFRCSFIGSNIKFIATSLVTGNVQIFASESDDLILRLIIDKLVINTMIQTETSGSDQ